MAAPKGNTNSKTGASIRDAIRYEVAKLGRNIEGDEAALVKGLRAIVEPHVLNAASGDLPSFKEVSDRLDGKAKQSVDLDVDGDINVNQVAVRFTDDGDSSE